MTSKRKLNNSVQESPKLIKGEAEARMSVGKHGTEEQRRAAATASVSPDATRFIPRQVRVKNQDSNT